MRTTRTPARFIAAGTVLEQFLGAMGVPIGHRIEGHPVWPLLCVAKHRGVTVAVGAESATPWMASLADITSIVAERLCGSIPR